MASRYKVAVVTICLNQTYWPYLGRMIDSARKFFLKNHEVDYFTWSDMENAPKDVRVFPTEPFDWPLPTLKRYHLFLQQEELLSQYDYVFYVDADMEFVSRVGDEILGNGLTVAQHPMYALGRTNIPPYEPNPSSKAYIPRLGRIVKGVGMKAGGGRGDWFEPLYLAGGFQGGRADSFIQAMKVMKGWIDEDFANNYVPVWNDESIWNAYLFQLTPTGLLPEGTIVLNPSYVYPDSLIREYYVKRWERNYIPKLVTLTKPFSLTKEGGQALNQILK